MYRCDICAGVFDQPRAITENRPDADGYWERMEKSVCPLCGESRFSPVEPCSCGGWKGQGEALCPSCRQSVKARFCAFCDQLTEEQQEVLDDMLDGMSIGQRAQFC